MSDILALSLGLSLPWAFGTLLIGVAYRRWNAAEPISWGWIVGCGWFVGIFILTLLMRGLSAAGVPFGVAAIGVPLAIATLSLGWLAARRSQQSFGSKVMERIRALSGGGLGGWRKAAWLALIAWLALRFILLLAEIGWRPLYPWDAWTQWGTKARVWFELKSLVPFVSAFEWLSATPANGYFDAASHYPATVPLFQVWTALLIGRWDDALVNLPWWVSGVALAMAFYGALVDLKFVPLVALVGTTMLMSLPILNVHIALAGYADLPMSAYVTLGALAALRFLRTRSPADAGLAILLLVACVMVKNPGKAWIAVLLPGLAVAALPRCGKKLAATAFAAAAIAILVLTQSGIRVLNYQLSPEFSMPWSALFEAYFTYGNWNLLWYCAVGVAVLGWRQLFSRDVAPLSCIVAAALLFLFVGFAFTNAGAWVEDQSTVNRATLHLAPLIVVWMFVTLRAWCQARVSVRIPHELAGSATSGAS